LLVFALALAIVAAAATVFSLLGFNIDLSIASLFYDPRTKTFLAGKESVFAWLRDHGAVAMLTCAAFVALALRALSWRRLPSVPPRAAVFLTISLLLGPGLLINVILKDNWGRPRPGSVIELGGAQPYIHWWNRSGTCQNNCSFASGEAAAAAWMFGPAMLAPPHWRAAAMAGAAVFTITMSALRVAAGGHFLTDVVFGVLISLAVLLAVHNAVFGWRWAGAPHYLRRKRSTTSTAA
jgi:membrane-associated PAP2 superfamily phosphatase